MATVGFKGLTRRTVLLGGTIITTRQPSRRTDDEDKAEIIQK